LDKNKMLLPTTETRVRMENLSAWRCACESCGNLTILLISGNKFSTNPTTTTQKVGSPAFVEAIGAISVSVEASMAIPQVLDNMVILPIPQSGPYFPS
jgi:hypothetical protein